MRLFVFGLGFSALAFIEAYRTQFTAIGGTVRSADKAAELTRSGVEALLFSGATPADPAIAAWLATADAVLVSIPPGAGGCPALDVFGRAIAAAKSVTWLGYLSTVGVYGDHNGEWVDETTPLATRNARSLLRVEAERAWSELATEAGKPLDILRLPGIYGPGRNALVDLANGRARRIARPGQVFNRIHVADIAITLAVLTRRAAATRATPPVAIYNVSDDEPAPQTDVVSYAASLLGVPAPTETTLDEAGLSPMGLSFWTENKRISNARLKRELSISLAYPNYRAGLDALFAAGDGRMHAPA